MAGSVLVIVADMSFVVITNMSLLITMLLGCQLGLFIVGFALGGFGVVVPTLLLYRRYLCIDTGFVSTTL